VLKRLDKQHFSFRVNIVMKDDGLSSYEHPETPSHVYSATSCFSGAEVQLGTKLAVGTYRRDRLAICGAFKKKGG